MSSPTLPPRFKYMTRILGRNPVDKAHRQIGHAKSAIKMSGGGELYEINQDGSIKLLWNVNSYELPEVYGKLIWPWEDQDTAKKIILQKEIEDARNHFKHCQKKIGFWLGEVFAAEDRLKELKGR